MSMTYALVQEVFHMNRQLSVGIIGDYNPAMRSHIATGDALRHAAAALSVSVEPTWLPTDTFVGEDIGAALQRYDAFWCSPGSPYKSMDGALAAIRYAREQGRPFIGT